MTFLKVLLKKCVAWPLLETRLPLSGKEEERSGMKHFELLALTGTIIIPIIPESIIWSLVLQVQYLLREGGLPAAVALLEITRINVALRYWYIKKISQQSNVC